MTQVAAPVAIPTSHELVQVRKYEAGPPPGMEIVEPGETFATTKEEEWVSKKKTELTTTKQIETRVKRQVVLEDGKVVEDSGPIVTTNTTEDTEKQEHHQTELRKQGDDEVDNANPDKAIEGGKGSPVLAKEGRISVPNPDGVVREVKEKRVITREEIDERKEFEENRHLGDITDKAYLSAVHSGAKDIRPALFHSTSLQTTGPRLVSETTNRKKTTDTEDTNAVSSVRPDGKIVTETKTTTEHEEVVDKELPEGETVEEKEVENSQRYSKTKDQEVVEYLADGVKIGEEMRYRAETTEGERFGDGVDDWDSLSARMRRQRRHHTSRNHQRHKDIVGPPLDRKDALTKKPLDYDEEEETRKAETSKWLENHFGSESTRSSRDSIDLEEPPVHSKSYFNVTIKSQPTRNLEPENIPVRIERIERVYSPEPDKPVKNGYFQGISDWSERRRQEEEFERYRTSPYTNGHHQNGSTLQKSSTYRFEETQISDRPVPPERRRAIERRQRNSQDSNRYDSGYRTHSRNEMSRDSHEDIQDLEPPPDYSPLGRSPSPSPPREQQQIGNKKSWQKTRFATSPPKVKGNIIGQSIRKLVGKIRSASQERKLKSRQKRSPSPPTYHQYNVIEVPLRGPSREYSSDRSPVMATDHPTTVRRSTSPPQQITVHRYYLGEDPFGGSIYGRENKYDGVKPARGKRRERMNGVSEVEEGRSSNTLGRFSKSTSKLVSSNGVDYTRTSQTLPRKLHSTENYGTSPPTRLQDNTINVSIINTVSSDRRNLVNGAPAKPARTYKSHLARSKSFNAYGAPENNMYRSNPQLHRLEENPIGLKSPGIVSMLSRSQRDLTNENDYNQTSYTSRYVKNGYSTSTENGENKRTYIKNLKERTPEIFRTLEQEESSRWSSKPVAYSTPLKTSRIANYSQDIYEPPTRLNETLAPQPVPSSTLRRGSNSSENYSETYHITSRNDDPKHPSVTNTVQSFSKKTVPTKNGRSMQTIESTETRSVTKSRYREPTSQKSVTYYENGHNGHKYSSSNNHGVVIEVKNYRN